MTRLILLFVLFCSGPLLAEDDFLKPDEAFRATAKALDHNRVEIRWQVADGYYLYKDKISFRSKTTGIEAGAMKLPEAEIKQDEFFGAVPIYRKQATVELGLLRSNSGKESLTLIAKSQGCADSGLCYPPHEQILTLQLPPTLAGKPSTPLEGKKKKSTLSLFEPLGGGPAGMDQEEILPVEQAFRFSATAVDGNNIELSWQVAPRTYLYQDQIRIALQRPNSVTLGDWQLPKAKIKQNAIRPDGTEGDLAVYDQDFTFTIPLQRGSADPTAMTLDVAYQGCAEAGICYPPQQQKVTLKLPAGIVQSTLPSSAPPESEVVSEQDQITNLLKGGNTWVIILSFFGVGLLLALTPCIFPMIPILSGIIAGHGTSITTRKAFMLSLIYVLAMAITYTVAGVLAGLFGENLQAAFQNPWILWSFALVFVALALSMFGYYDLQLPSSLQSKLGNLSNKQRGGTYTGVAVMGFLSALIVGPCVAPPLAGALIYIGQTGDAVLGGLALFAMSLGMGMPLIVIGTGAGKLLPRAGAWMNAVKSVFGVMMLAVAILLLERVIDPTYAMLLWGLLLICSSIYMGALSQLPTDAPGLSKLRKGLGIAMLVYGSLMLLGVAANGKDTLQPLRGLGFAGGSGNSQQAHLQFKRIKSYADLEREVASANKQGKAVMLDFYADWCTYCIQFEKYVFTDPKVQATLRNLVLLQADVTANDGQDKQLLNKLGITAPPAILFWDKSGREQRNFRVMGYMDAEKFNGHLLKVVR